MHFEAQFLDALAEAIADKVAARLGNGHNRLLTVREAAEHLSVSESQVYRLAYAGALHPVDVSENGGKRCLRFEAEDLERFIRVRSET